MNVLNSPSSIPSITPYFARIRQQAYLCRRYNFQNYCFLVYSLTQGFTGRPRYQMLSLRMLKAFKLFPRGRGLQQLLFSRLQTSLQRDDSWVKKSLSLLLLAITGFCFRFLTKPYFKSLQSEIEASESLLTLFETISGIVNPIFWGKGLKVAQKIGVAGRVPTKCLKFVFLMRVLLQLRQFSLFQFKRVTSIYSLIFIQSKEPKILKAES